MRIRLLSFSRTTLLWLGTLACCFGPLQTLAAAQPTSADRPQSVPRKVQRYSRHFITRYDGNRDERLQASEWSPSGDVFKTCDRDDDQLVTSDELSEFIFAYGKSRRVQLAPLPHAAPSVEPVEPGITAADDESDDPAAAEPATSSDDDGEQPANSKKAATRKYYTGSRSGAAPPWFTSRDRDGDGQLTLAEFTANASGQKNEFRRVDRNRDGIITVGELSNSAKREQ